MQYHGIWIAAWNGIQLHSAINAMQCFRLWRNVMWYLPQSICCCCGLAAADTFSFSFAASPPSETSKEEVEAAASLPLLVAVHVVVSCPLYLVRPRWWWWWWWMQMIMAAHCCCCCCCRNGVSFVHCHLLHLTPSRNCGLFPPNTIPLPPPYIFITVVLSRSCMLLLLLFSAAMRFIRVPIMLLL